MFFPNFQKWLNVKRFVKKEDSHAVNGNFEDLDDSQYNKRVLS